MSNTRRFLALAAWLGTFLAGPATRGADGAGALAVPVGPPFASSVERPTDDGRPACSFGAPLCVHASRDVAPVSVLDALADLERAASRFDAIGVPRPLADRALGGSSAFDVYLVSAEAPELRGASVLVARDAPRAGRLDRASAFALLRADVSGCARRNLVARAYASAAQWGIDAGESAAVRESNSAYLAELIAPCAAVTDELIDDFQSHPERALTSAGDAAGPAIAMALPWYVDAALGSGAPGTMPIALSVIGTQKTPAGALFWNNDPDSLDALRGVLKARTPALALGDLWTDFAVARLFMGARDDGTHFPESAFTGAFGRVRFDWSVPFSSLPRRLSPELPIDPTGATFVWIDLRGAPAGARLAFRMEWEAPVLFRWAFVRVKPDGTEASRVLVTPQQKSTSAERNLDALDGLSGVAVVGVNLGDLRLDDPFDPDIAPYEPHSYVITVATAP